MEALRERFEPLFNKLMREYGLEETMENYCDPEDIYNYWEDSDDAANHYGIWVGTGATKFVIGDDNCDYIIKFCPSDEFDYCGREVEVYEEAVRAGYEDKFAWCAYLFDYDLGNRLLPVYVMEWCQCGYDQIDDEMDDWHYTKFCSSHGLSKGDKAFDEYCNSENRWGSGTERMLEWAFDCWGGVYDATSEFLAFMRKMYINDLHPGNWGWHNNQLVLVDYSGYGDCFSCRSIDY
jgi:hypothetical protein